MQQPPLRTQKQKAGINPYSLRATRATLFLGGLGVIGFAAYGVPKTPAALSFTVFYALLVLNTFYSIRSFAKITDPKDRAQQIIDIVIACIYAVLAFSAKNSLLFLTVLTIYWIASVVKYLLLLRKNPYKAFIERKIRINIMALALTNIGIVVALSGYATLIAIAGTALFFALNIYLLWIRPMYQIGDAV